MTILGEAFLTTVGEAFLIRRLRFHDTATVWHNKKIAYCWIRRMAATYFTDIAHFFCLLYPDGDATWNGNHLHQLISR